MLTRSHTAAEIRKANPSRRISDIFPIEVLMLQGYFSVKDISHLDIAICDDQFRQVFLNSLQAIKICDDIVCDHGDNFVTWIIKRRAEASYLLPSFYCVHQNNKNEIRCTRNIDSTYDAKSSNN